MCVRVCECVSVCVCVCVCVMERGKEKHGIIYEQDEVHVRV